ncbi:MAG: flavodoxin family protein [Spirochaetaceae bacterium]
MNIVFLNGSGRADGNTNYLLSKIVNSLDETAITSEIINISDKEINFCRGCHVCEETRVCVQTDGVDEIYNSFKKADLICIASPSYWGDITGQLKTFIDRSTPYCNTINSETTFPSGKKSCSIAIRAGSAENENRDVISTITHYLGHLEIDHVLSETWESIRSKNDLETEEVEKKISKFAKQITLI